MYNNKIILAYYTSIMYNYAKAVRRADKMQGGARRANVQTELPCKYI